jgi:hypothetical protein
MRWLLLLAVLGFLAAAQINPWAAPASNGGPNCHSSGVVTSTLPDGSEVMTSSIACE